MSVWPYPIRVAGISFRMTDNSQLLSDEIWVAREGGNEHDPNAVAVWSVKGEEHLHVGYLPKEIAAQIKDEDLPAKGEIVWKATEGIGLRIQI